MISTRTGSAALAMEPTNKPIESTVNQVSTTRRETRLLMRIAPVEKSRFLPHPAQPLYRAFQLLAPFVVYSLRLVESNSHFWPKLGFLLSYYLKEEEDDDSKLVANWCENWLPRTTSSLCASPPTAAGRRVWESAADRCVRPRRVRIIGHRDGLLAMRQEFWRDHNLGVRSARVNDVAGSEIRRHANARSITSAR